MVWLWGIGIFVFLLIVLAVVTLATPDTAPKWWFATIKYISLLFIIVFNAIVIGVPLALLITYDISSGGGWICWLVWTAFIVAANADGIHRGRVANERVQSETVVWITDERVPALTEPTNWREEGF